MENFRATFIGKGVIFKKGDTYHISTNSVGSNIEVRAKAAGDGCVFTYKSMTELKKDWNILISSGNTMETKYNATAVMKGPRFEHPSGLYKINIHHDKEDFNVYYEQGNFMGKMCYKSFSDLLIDWTNIKAIVPELAKPDDQKLATFIGTDSLGYVKGKKYWLRLFYSKSGVTITDCNGNKKCEYESMKAFMLNWDNICT